MHTTPSVAPSPPTPVSGPRVITGYHGSGEMFDQFHLSPRGTYGAGIYAGDHAVAKEYASNCGRPYLYEVEITFQNAFSYEAVWDDEIDSPAVNLVRQIFDPAEAEGVVAMLAASDDCHFGPELMNRLRALGYDGLVARYSESAFEYVAFETSQVEILSITTL